MQMVIVISGVKVHTGLLTCEDAANHLALCQHPLLVQADAQIVEEQNPATLMLVRNLSLWYLQVLQDSGCRPACSAGLGS